MKDTQYGHEKPEEIRINGLIPRYPSQAEFNRVLPKTIIYKNANPSSAVKKRFVSDVDEIVWKYKLSKETINIAPKDGLSEIQIFEIKLRTVDFSRDILKTIDKTIKEALISICYARNFPTTLSKVFRSAI